MSFKLENFVAAPSMELLNLAKKTDLLNIADHYGLTSVKPSMFNHEIKNILIKFLVDEEILDPSALSSVLITQTDLQLRELDGWLVGFFGFNGPLRQYFSLYRAVSQRGGRVVQRCWVNFQCRGY